MGLSNALTLLLYSAVLWAVVFPVFTFLHECGHALMALALTDRNVTILLGGGRNSLRWQWGRLRVAIGWWFTGFVGFARYDQEQIPSHHILYITLAGPFVSLLLAVLFWNLGSTWSGSGWFERVMETFAYSAFAQFLFTILPLRYPRWLGAYGGRTSDGWRALQLLRKQRHVT